MMPQDEEKQRKAQRQPAGKEPVDADKDVSGYRVVLSHLTQLPQQVVPADFAGRVMTEIQRKQPLYQDSWLWVMLVAISVASPLIGLMVSSQFDPQVAGSLLSMVEPYSYWFVLGLCYFVAIQWFDQRAYVHRLEKDRFSS